MPDVQGLLNACYDANENAIRVTSAFEAIFYSPGELTTMAGSPTNVTTNGVPRLGFPDAATTTVGITFGVPKWWQFFGVGMVWCGSSVGTNPVRWQVDVEKNHVFVDNISEAAFRTATANVATPGTAGVTTYTVDHVANVDATPDAFGNVFAVTLSRIGADAGDTYTGVAELISLVVRRNTGP